MSAGAERAACPHVDALGAPTSCENAERHIARLSEYLGEANDEIERLKEAILDALVDWGKVKPDDVRNRLRKAVGRVE